MRLRVVEALPELLAGPDWLHDFRAVVVEDEQGEGCMWEATTLPVLDSFSRFLLQSFERLNLKHDVAGVVRDLESRFHIPIRVSRIGWDTIMCEKTRHFESDPLFTDV